MNSDRQHQYIDRTWDRLSDAIAKEKAARSYKGALQKELDRALSAMFYNEFGLSGGDYMSINYGGDTGRVKVIFDRVELCPYCTSTRRNKFNYRIVFRHLRKKDGKPFKEDTWLTIGSEDNIGYIRKEKK